MFPGRFLWVLPVSAILAVPALAQSDPEGVDDTTPAWLSAEGCDATGHRSEFLVCVPAPFEGTPLSPMLSPPLLASIALKIPPGPPLRIAIDERTRIQRVEEPVHGKVVEAVYTFDQEVIPEGSVATGKVTRIAPVSGLRRTLAYINGNLTPFHEYEVTFDRLTLPGGKQVPIHTVARPGTAQVVHLVSNPDKQKNLAGRATDRAKSEAKGKIAEAKEEARDAWGKLTAPGKMQRLKEFLLAQSPYRRQYLLPETRFLAELREPLDFGETMRTSVQLAAVGSQPVADSLLKARLVAEVSSATATRGTPVAALLTEPVYSADHQLILPANTRLVGQVVKAKAARAMHRNGELRVVFERIESSEEAVHALAELQAQEQIAQAAAERTEAQRTQAMIGNLEGVEVDRNAHMQLDEEGGAHTTTSKTRYLSTGLAVMLAAAASHTEVEHGTTEMAGPGVRTAAGGSGFRATGALLSLAAKSTPVSVALGAYGASTAIYANFIGRGHDVVLPKDTPLEIGFGPPHTRNP